jgi:hypothetical protein
MELLKRTKKSGKLKCWGKQSPISWWLLPQLVLRDTTKITALYSLQHVIITTMTMGAKCKQVKVILTL